MRKNQSRRQGSVYGFALSLLMGATLLTWSLVSSPAWADTVTTTGDQVRIWPTNNSTLLVNQRFDLRIESTFPAESGTEPMLVSLTINEEDFTEAFEQGVAEEMGTEGGELEAGTPDEPELYGQTLRNFSFDSPGAYQIEATLEIDGEELTALNTYRIQDFSPTEDLNKIIFYVGDGMGVPLRTGARIMEYGVRDGQPGGKMQMERMPELGLMSVHSLNSIIPDSANTAAAWASGTKTINNAMNAFPDNTPDNPFDNPRVETLMQYMKRNYNWGTGLVTTAFTTDATPGAFGSNIVARSELEAIAQEFLDYFDDDFELPATGYQSWEELAQPVDVILGPGARAFVPEGRIEEFRDSSFRDDDQDLSTVAQELGYTIVRDLDEMNQAPDEQPLLGLFLGDFREGSALGAQNTPSILDLLIARGEATLEGRTAEELEPPIPDEFAQIPTLTEMQQKGIAVLDALHPEGWILQVESSQSDKLAHPLDPDRTLYEVLTLDEAVGRGREYATQDGGTLLIVTSDHAQGQTVGGTVDSLGIREGRVDLRDAMRSFERAGFTDYVDSNGDGYPDDPTPPNKIAVGISARPVLRTDFLTDDLNFDPTEEEDGTEPNPQRDPEGLLLTADLQRETTVANHTGDDVAIAAEGPGSQLFNGLIDNIEVFQRMAAAISGARERDDLAEFIPDAN